MVPWNGEGTHGEAGGYLTFPAGAQIEVTFEGEPNGWWEGKLGTTQGWFPAAYTEGGVLHNTSNITASLAVVTSDCAPSASLAPNASEKARKVGNQAAEKTAAGTNISLTESSPLPSVAASSTKAALVLSPTPRAALARQLTRASFDQLCWEQTELGAVEMEVAPVGDEAVAFESTTLPSKMSEDRPQVVETMLQPDVKQHTILPPPTVEDVPEVAPAARVSIATHAFDNEGAVGFLSFPAGARITVVAEGAPGDWWQGEVDGTLGWFPSAYTQDEMTSETVLVASDAPAAADVPEKDCLSAARGALCEKASCECGPSAYEANTRGASATAETAVSVPSPRAALAKQMTNATLASAVVETVEINEAMMALGAELIEGTSVDGAEDMIELSTEQGGMRGLSQLGTSHVATCCAAAHDAHVSQAAVALSTSSEVPNEALMMMMTTTVVSSDDEDVDLRPSSTSLVQLDQTSAGTLKKTTVTTITFSSTSTIETTSRLPQVSQGTSLDETPPCGQGPLCRLLSLEETALGSSCAVLPMGDAPFVLGSIHSLPPPAKRRNSWLPQRFPSPRAVPDSASPLITAATEGSPLGESLSKTVRPNAEELRSAWFLEVLLVGEALEDWRAAANAIGASGATDNEGCLKRSCSNLRKWCPVGPTSQAGKARSRSQDPRAFSRALVMLSIVDELERRCEGLLVRGQSNESSRRRASREASHKQRRDTTRRRKTTLGSGADQLRRTEESEDAKMRWKKAGLVTALNKPSPELAHGNTRSETRKRALLRVSSARASMVASKELLARELDYFNHSLTVWRCLPWIFAALLLTVSNLLTLWIALSIFYECDHLIGEWLVSIGVASTFTAPTPTHAPPRPFSFFLWPCLVCT